MWDGLKGARTLRREAHVKDVGVQRIREFCDDLVENAILRRQRITLVEQLIPVCQREDVLAEIHSVVQEARATYPTWSVDVNIIDGITAYKLASESEFPEGIGCVLPQRDTWCRYTVAAAKPFEVLDSMTDLIVCESPHAGKIRSYAGVPLIVRSWAVGVFCVYSKDPRPYWRVTDKVNLARWAAEVSDVLERAYIELGKA